MAEQKTKPNMTPILGTVVDVMIIPAMKAIRATLKTRAMGSLSVTITTASWTATASDADTSATTPDRRDTAGDSRASRKMKYNAKAPAGTRKAITRITVRTVAKTIRKVMPSRPGVGCKSCQNRSIQI
jgi:hypothetical protein